MTKETGDPKKRLRVPATKEGVATMSVIAVSLLVAMKVVASILTGSISIRADALHSVIDLSGVVIGFIGIRIARKLPDKQHVFGHGKAEDIAAFFIGVLIFVAAGTIAYTSIERLVVGAAIELVSIGIYVTSAAIMINVIVAWCVVKVAKSSDSVALEATGRHLLTDVWSSVAVLVGLILVRVTGFNILDPIVALLVSILIGRIAYQTTKKAFGGLMDIKLPAEEEDLVVASIMEHSDQILDLHKLRSRKAGSQRYIDLHLVMPKDVNIVEAHRLCDHLEQDIEEKLQVTDATIHIEPCNDDCDLCSASCTLQNKSD
ncbi:cation diffusion facilitator family transporter [Chloroflexota bacterium]